MSEQTAKIILSQLGGSNKLAAMIGANNFISHSTTKLGGLSFRIKCQGAKANYVKIILNGNDLYDVEMGKIRGLNYKVTYSQEDIFAEDLKEIIERETGLYLSL